jgi:AraC family transcriptional regulator
VFIFCAHAYAAERLTAGDPRLAIICRRLEECGPPEVDELRTPPTADQLVVLVTGGSCDIESRYKGRWRGAHFQAGSLAMTAPCEEGIFRWRGKTRHNTLQLHIPAATIRAMTRELSNGKAYLSEMPNKLISEDPLLQQIMLSGELLGRASPGASLPISCTAAAIAR